MVSPLERANRIAAGLPDAIDAGKVGIVVFVDNESEAIEIGRHVFNAFGHPQKPYSSGAVLLTPGNREYRLGVLVWSMLQSDGFRFIESMIHAASKRPGSILMIEHRHKPAVIDELASLELA
jgi:FixJ family two-component response regulator